jgi:pimeloyl-ACP methyl ester carboxylesterase
MKTSQERRPELTERQGTSDVRAVALLLPGGSITSRRKPLKIVEWGMRAPLTRLADQGGVEGVAVHLLRYRYRGWNGAEASTADDVQWALTEIRRRYGDVPVSLIGNSLGGRAAFWAAGHPSVVSVAGVAPWLPESDPVDHLAGRKVLILHGDRDRSEASPALSLAFAERARQVTPDVCRLVVPGGNHLLLAQAAHCWALTTTFVLDTLGGRQPDDEIVSAMAAEDGLSTPLFTGSRLTGIRR